MKILNNLLIAVTLLVPTLSIASETALIPSTQGNNTSYFPSLTSALKVCKNNKNALGVGLTAAWWHNGLRQLNNQLTSYEEHINNCAPTLSYYDDLKNLEKLELSKLKSLNEETTNLIDFNTNRMKTSPLHFFTKPFKWFGDWLYNKELQSIATKIDKIKNETNFLLNIKNDSYKNNVKKLDTFKNNPLKCCKIIKIIRSLQKSNYLSIQDCSDKKCLTSDKYNNFTQLIKEKHSESIDAALFKNCNFVSQNLKECLDSLSKDLKNSLDNLRQLVYEDPLYFPKARLIIFAQDMIKDFEKADNDSLNDLALKIQCWHSRARPFFKNFSDDIKFKIIEDKFLDHLAGILAKKITSKNIDLSKIDLGTQKNLNALLSSERSLLNPLVKIITDDIKTNGNSLHKSSALLLLLNQYFDRINAIKNNNHQDNAPEIDALQKNVSIVVDCIQKHSITHDKNEFAAVSVLYLEYISTILDIMDYLSTHVTESNQKFWKDTIKEFFNQTDNFSYSLQDKYKLSHKIIKNILKKICLLHTIDVFDEKEKSDFLENFYKTLFKFNILSYGFIYNPLICEFIYATKIAQIHAYVTPFKEEETTHDRDFKYYLNLYRQAPSAAKNATKMAPNLMPKGLAVKYLDELDQIFFEKGCVIFPTLLRFWHNNGIVKQSKESLTIPGTGHCSSCRETSTLNLCKDCTAAKKPAQK